jgi:hypothetical protein
MGRRLRVMEERLRALEAQVGGSVPSGGEDA